MKRIIFILIAGFSVLSIQAEKNNDKSELLKSSSIYPYVPKWRQVYLKKMPKYDPNNYKVFAVDLRSYNLSKLDLRNDYNNLIYADFNTQTVWPALLPKEFDPGKVMELGKNPGLGVRKLHKEGITGKGVGVAIIDQRLLRTHNEYKGRLRLYKEFGYEKDSQEDSMHASAVSSIAVGRTCGVAPEADLYFFAANNLRTLPNDKYELYYDDHTKAINYVLELNKILPAKKKIRVISISWGYEKNTKGLNEFSETVLKAKKAGILVITTDLYHAFDYFINGIGRNELSNPDDITSATPGLFWEQALYRDRFWKSRNMIYVPMDNRTTADFTGDNEYVFYSGGGLSWTVPWLAGMYALACQVDPDITPEKFLKTAFETGTEAVFKHDNKEYKDVGNIINPKNLINTLKKENKNS